MINNEQLAVIEDMMHSRVDNYIWPGLSSVMIGGKDKGSVRMFVNSREQHTSIIPHSHRFNFTCLVLRGSVSNRTWHQSDTVGDEFSCRTLKYTGKIGKHVKSSACSMGLWTYNDREYTANHFYSMDAEEVHSIIFSKDAQVLFFEGPTESNSSVILEPVVNGAVIPTYKVEPWMFLEHKKNA